MGCVLAEVVKY